MKSFKTYLREQFLLEYKEWHQYIKHNGDSILSKMGHTEEYAKLSSEPNHGTPEHKTNYIKSNLGMGDMSKEHGRWVLDALNKEKIDHLEDIPTSIATNLRRFDQLKSEGRITAKLGNVQNPTQLFNLVSKHDTKLMDERRGLEQGKDYSVLGENEHWTVYQPHTSKAACGLGSGSNWCTTSGKFDSYNEEGPLNIFIPKKPAYPGEKYQYHQPTGQFMDYQNKGIYSKRKGPNFSSRPSPLGETHPSYFHDLSFDPNASKENLQAITHSSIPSGFVSTAIKSPHLEIQKAAVTHPNFASAENDDVDVLSALKSPHVEVAQAVLNHRNFRERHIISALNSRHVEVALETLKHPIFNDDSNYGSGYISSALQSKHPEVAQAALKLPVFGSNPFHISHALESRHVEVVQAGTQHPNFGHPDVLNSAVGSKNIEVARLAVQHPNFKFNDRSLLNAIISPHLEIARLAIEHPNFGNNPNHFFRALGSKHSEIQERALNHEKIENHLSELFRPLYGSDYRYNYRNVDPRLMGKLDKLHAKYIAKKRS